MKFVRKQVKEPQWPSWWSWNSKRQSQEKQKKPTTKPAAIKSESNGCQKPVDIKNKKPEQTVDDGFDTWYRCDSCDKLFAKKLELEWHLREPVWSMPHEVSQRTTADRPSHQTPRAELQVETQRLRLSMQG
ncbi:hypothetical protein HPB51_027482 [Rhipicephalus microplus]|uniref:C2H2-type domain-containing protein n=1 Tax=Rhipicephalus microplus TaxID=6941 RepID=A0A9J6CZY9_RHIMP|nr:hypothetical protein HPB51_027482 [Rhipicephalus microplus]